MKTILMILVLTGTFFFPQPKVMHLQINAPDKQVVTESHDSYDGIMFFHAEWCGPCKQLKKVWDKVEAEENAEEDGGELTNKHVWRVDIDQRPDKRKSWKVVGVPTVILYKWHKEKNTATEIARQVGYMNETQLKKFLGLHNEPISGDAGVEAPEQSLGDS
jgi:thiol-disulfide isomerase/thioredoxin